MNRKPGAWGHYRWPDRAHIHTLAALKQHCIHRDTNIGTRQTDRELANAARSLCPRGDPTAVRDIINLHLGQQREHPLPVRIFLSEREAGFVVKAYWGGEIQVSFTYYRAPSIQIAPGISALVIKCNNKIQGR